MNDNDTLAGVIPTWGGFNPFPLYQKPNYSIDITNLSPIKSLERRAADPTLFSTPISGEQKYENSKNKFWATSRVGDLQLALDNAEDDKLTRSQKKLLQKRIDANQALLDAGGDSKLLSKKQQRYLGDDSEVTQNLEEHKEKVANTANLLSTGFNLVGSAFGEDNSMNGPGAQSAGVQATSALLKMGKEEIGKALPWAKVGFAANDALTNMFGGTDGMTAQDAIISNIPGLSVINAAFGKKSNPLVKDTETLAYLGGGYDATEDDIIEASKKAGKKYGVFSNSARRKANAQIADALSQQEIMGNIAYDTQQDRLTESSMTDIFSNLQSSKSTGGWNSRVTYLVRQGGKLFSDSAISNVRSILKHQQGNKITKTRSLQELIDYAKLVNPRFVQRMSEQPKYIKLDDGHVATHMLMSGTWEGKDIVFPKVQEINGKLTMLSNEEAFKNAIKNKDYIIFNNANEAEKFAINYKQGWPKFFNYFEKFQNGGKFNVIPDGALHARLHHLDIDGITNKGIPVVVQKKGGEVEQQAEVERNEIIFNLDTTKKLEALWKDGSDEAAIEAGKLLVSEILENTVDNTGLLKEV